MLTDVPEIELSHLDDLWFQVGGTRCNLSCHHCFISCHPKNNNFGFLTLEDIRCRLAESVTLGLCETSLRGVDSHGIRLLNHYVLSAVKGRKNPKPNYKFYKSFPALVNFGSILLFFLLKAFRFFLLKYLLNGIGIYYLSTLKVKLSS